MTQPSHPWRLETWVTLLWEHQIKQHFSYCVMQLELQGRGNSTIMTVPYGLWCDSTKSLRLILLALTSRCDDCLCIFCRRVWCWHTLYFLIGWVSDWGGRTVGITVPRCPGAHCSEAWRYVGCMGRPPGEISTAPGQIATGRTTAGLLWWLSRSDVSMHSVKSRFNENQNDRIYVQQNFSSVLTSWLYILM